MPRRRKSGRGRRRGGNAEKHQSVVEHVTFSCATGKSTSFPVSVFTSVPPNRAWRFVRAWVEVSGAHWSYVNVTTKDMSSGYIPSWVQLNFYNNGGGRSASTGAVLVGPNPRRVSLSYPPSEDWYPLSHPKTSTVFAIDVGCIKQPPAGFATPAVVGICHFLIHVGVEEYSEGCPTLSIPTVITSGDEESDSGHQLSSSWAFGDRE